MKNRKKINFPLFIFKDAFKLAAPEPGRRGTSSVFAALFHACLLLFGRSGALSLKPRLGRCPKTLPRELSSCGIFLCGRCPHPPGATPLDPALGLFGGMIMVAEILSIGTELLMGQIANTDA